MTVLFIVFVLAALSVLVAGYIKKRRLIESKSITPEAALEAWRNEEYFIDVRTPEEYNGGHVPGAALIPIKELAARKEEVPKDRKVYLICRSGHRSSNATYLLLRQKYDNVYNVSGGMLQWKGPSQ